jgi:hypothetical protein
MVLGIPHDYGSTWVFYVIVPVILSGIVAGMWLMVRGAIGLLDRTRREGYDRRCVGPRLFSARELNSIGHELRRRVRTLTPTVTRAVQ